MQANNMSNLVAYLSDPLTRCPDSIGVNIDHGFRPVGAIPKVIIEGSTSPLAIIYCGTAEPDDWTCIMAKLYIPLT